MSDFSYKKTKATYELSTTYGPDDKVLTLTIDIHLNKELRTISIKGKNDKFEIRESDPYLVEAFSQLFEEAVTIANREQRSNSEEK